MQFSKLFEPIRIGNVKIRNRVAMAPMVTQYCDRGYVSEQQIAYYGARARGGVGLIVTEHVLASRWAEDNCPLNVMGLYDPHHMLGLADLVETIHAFGAKTFVQLNPGVGTQGSSMRTGVQPVGPSAMRYEATPEMMPRNCQDAFAPYRTGEMAREMTIEEIEAAQFSFVKSAMMAQVAGFDGLEIHSAHGFLLSEFLSPHFNRRTDRYGGSLENRMRFLTELVRSVRAAVGDKMALGVRLSADEHTPRGSTYPETCQIVQRLEEEHVDYIHVGDGVFESLKYTVPDEPETMVAEAAGLKKRTNIPILMPTVHDPVVAEQALREGQADMISLGRQLIADPEWANKVRDGRIDAITKCDRCNRGCFARIFQGLRVKCLRNPESGLERYNPQYTQWHARGRAIQHATAQRPG